MDWFSQYGFLGALLLSGIILGAIPVVLPLIISPSRTRSQKAARPTNAAWTPLAVHGCASTFAYYLFALIFVAFEVDVLYILPIAVIYDSGTYVWRDFIELTIFVGISFSRHHLRLEQRRFALEKSIMAQTETPSRSRRSQRH